MSLLAPYSDIRHYGQPQNVAEKQYSAECGLDPRAQQLARLIIEDPLQQRLQLSCHSILAQAAADKAKQMAEHGRVDHFVGGMGANQRLRALGYPLPPYYSSITGNSVEAVAGGYTSAAEVWEAFKSSSRHRSHLLGETAFFAEQNHLGVGFYYKWHSPHLEYWVVYIAREARADDPKQLCLDIGCVAPD